jgi:TonB-like protein
VKGALNTAVLLAVLGLLFTQGAYAQATYQLKPTPKTVAWGYYDAKAAPVLRAKSGATVEIQTPVASRATPAEDRPIIYVKHLEPPLRYPPLARVTRLSGTIVIKLMIAADGTVLSTESTRGDKDTTGFEILRDDAEKLIKKWTFGCVGCPPNAAFEHTIKFKYGLDNEDLLPDNRVVMNLPDEVAIFANPPVIDHGGPPPKKPKRGSN